MTESRADLDPSLEEFLAELTVAAYRVSLRYGVKGSSIDLELDLWRELREVLREQLLAVDSPAAACDRGSAQRRPARTLVPERPDLLEVVV